MSTCSLCVVKGALVIVECVFELFILIVIVDDRACYVGGCMRILLIRLLLFVGGCICYVEGGVCIAFRFLFNYNWMLYMIVGRLCPKCFKFVILGGRMLPLLVWRLRLSVFKLLDFCLSTVFVNGECCIWIALSLLVWLKVVFVVSMVVSDVL